MLTYAPHVKIKMLVKESVEGRRWLKGSIIVVSENTGIRGTSFLKWSENHEVRQSRLRWKLFVVIGEENDL